jgi:hypothetical protein
MSGGVDRLLDWCDDADLTWRALDGTVYVRLDPEDRLEVRLEQHAEDEPLRLHDRVDLSSADLPARRLAEVIEDVVLGRSSLVDARPTEDGRGAEVVALIHAEGLNRHTFLEAIFELQKLRLLLHREVGAAVAAEQTVATLTALIEGAPASA